jgi:hypothetical protein
MVADRGREGGFCPSEKGTQPLIAINGQEELAHYGLDWAQEGEGRGPVSQPGRSPLG